MITETGKRICDKEIKSKTGVWCGCRKPAVVQVPSTKVSSMTLDYCKGHAPK